MSGPKKPPATRPPAVEPIRFYSEEELDELEKNEPEKAYRIARAQAMARRDRTRGRAADTGPPAPDREQVRLAVEDLRQILSRDGGDIELVDVEGSVVRVRMKGACAGCPNAVIDLKNVVEVVLTAVPGVTEVRNTF